MCDIGLTGIYVFRNMHIEIDEMKGIKSRTTILILKIQEHVEIT